MFSVLSIDYSNSLLICLSKSRLSPLQSVLNTAARLIARLPRYSRISTFMFEELHWLPLRARIQFKILTLMFKAQRGLSPIYLIEVRYYFGLIQLSPNVHFVPPIDLTSWFPVLELLWLNLDQLASIGPSLWNALSPSLRSTVLSGSLSSTFASLKTLLLSLLLKPVFSHGALRTVSASERFTLLEAL